MMRIKADQVVFTRVEEKYSPRHVSGYQVYYASPNLDQSTVKTIEDRMRCFRPGDELVTRLQFFGLNDGRYVLTHTQVIPTDSEIMDKDLRPGIFLAHALIFTKHEFSQTLNNPFQIFSQFPSICSAKDLVNNYQLAEGKEPPAIFDLDPNISVNIDSSWTSEAINLLRLSYAAKEITQQGKSFLLLGPQQQVEEVLKATFKFTPPKRRLLCSFDTFTDRCKVEAGSYWAIGALDNPGGSFINIYANRRPIKTDLGSLPPDDLYISWLTKHVDEADTDITTIQILSEAFEEHSSPVLSVLETSSCKSFYTHHKKFIDQCFENSVTNAISPHLGPLVARSLKETAFSVPDILVVASTGKIPAPSLATNILLWLQRTAPSFKDIEKDDWKVLANFASQANNNALLFCSAAQMGNKKLLQQALNRMTQAEYDEVLVFIQNPIDPFVFVSRKYLNSLIQASLPILNTMETDVFLIFVETLLEAGGESLIAPLSQRVKKLESKPLFRLEKINKRYQNLPKAWSKAIANRRDELGPVSFLDRFF